MESSDRTTAEMSSSKKSADGKTSESAPRFIHPAVDVFLFLCIINDRLFVNLLYRKGDEIYHQLRKLGASLDWSRTCFTMDPVTKHDFTYYP